MRITNFLVTSFTWNFAFFLSRCIQNHIMCVDNNLIILFFIHLFFQINCCIFMNSLCERFVNGKLYNLICVFCYWLTQINRSIEILQSNKFKITSSFSITLSLRESDFLFLRSKNVNLIIFCSIFILNYLVLNLFSSFNGYKWKLSFFDNLNFTFNQLKFK